MRHLLSLALVSLAPTAFGQVIGGSLTSEHRPDEQTIHVYSGHGVPGGADAEVTYLAGPAGGLSSPITAADFAAAEAGPSAVVLDTWAWGNLGLTTHPNAQWIAPTLTWGTGVAGAASALLAIEFDVDVPVFTASLDFHYTADDDLGPGGTAGLFLNGKPIANTNATGAWWNQFTFPRRSIDRHLVQGRNVLYVHLSNTGGAGGILFDAIVRVNPRLPDECFEADEVWLGANQGTTVGATASSEASSCTVQGDTWHAFVPTEPGILTVDLDGLPGAGDLWPVLGVYTGDCGSLTELGCAMAPAPGGVASWSGAVEPGVPVYLRAGGATASSGRYALRLSSQPASSGFVNPANGHMYLPSPGPMDIVQARAWAAGLGGYLVAINDASEQAWETSKLGGTSIWIGASDELAEGTWLWDSGEPFVFEAWATGEPNDSAACNGEDHVQMDPSGVWRDYPAGPGPCGTTKRIALAELPATSLATVSELGEGCGPWELEPRLATGPHVLGTTPTVGTYHMEPGAPVILMRSPAPAAPVPLGSCLVQVDLGQALIVGTWLADAFGAGSYQVAVPNDPLLVGTVERWQAQLFPPDSSPSYTNGIEVRIGY